MKYLSILLHLYQPPTQIGFVIDDICRECYEPLVDIFTCELKPRFTLNINYSLTEQLEARGHTSIINSIRTAADQGSVEFVDSGAYHPIFPLIPEEEVKRQLRINREGNTRVFGPRYAPKGVFPPEMCFSGNVAQLFGEAGYEWCITDDLPYTHYNGTPPYNAIPSMHGVKVFLRSNKWSNELSFHTWKGSEFIRQIKDQMQEWFGNDDGYIILAMDGETFGHHHKYYEEKFLRSLLYALINDPEIQLVTLSDLAKKFPSFPSFVPPSTWSSSDNDMCNDDPYPLWHSKFNPIHHNQWVLTHHVMAQVKKVSDRDPLSRELLDKALYSCQYWWASSWNFDPSQIFRGAYLLLDTLEQSVRESGDREALRVGREMYNNLVFSIAERVKSQK